MAHRVSVKEEDGEDDSMLLERNDESEASENLSDAAAFSPVLSSGFVRRCPKDDFRRACAHGQTQALTVLGEATPVPPGVVLVLGSEGRALPAAQAF